MREAKMAKGKVRVIALFLILSLLLPPDFAGIVYAQSSESTGSPSATPAPSASQTTGMGTQTGSGSDGVQVRIHVGPAAAAASAAALGAAGNPLMTLLPVCPAQGAGVAAAPQPGVQPQVLAGYIQAQVPLQTQIRTPLIRRTCFIGGCCSPPQLRGSSCRPVSPVSDLERILQNIGGNLQGGVQPGLQAQAGQAGTGQVPQRSPQERMLEILNGLSPGVEIDPGLLGMTLEQIRNLCGIQGAPDLRIRRSERRPGAFEVFVVDPPPFGVNAPPPPTERSVCLRDFDGNYTERMDPQTGRWISSMMTGEREIQGCRIREMVIITDCPSNDIPLENVGVDQEIRIRFEREERERVVREFGKTPEPWDPTYPEFLSRISNRVRARILDERKRIREQRITEELRRHVRRQAIELNCDGTQRPLETTLCDGSVIKHGGGLGPQVDEFITSDGARVWSVDTSGLLPRTETNQQTGEQRQIAPTRTPVEIAAAIIQNTSAGSRTRFVDQRARNDAQKALERAIEDVLNQPVYGPLRNTETGEIRIGRIGSLREFARNVQVSVGSDGMIQIKVDAPDLPPPAILSIYPGGRSNPPTTYYMSFNDPVTGRPHETTINPHVHPRQNALIVATEMPGSNQMRRHAEYILGSDLKVDWEYNETTEDGWWNSRYAVVTANAVVRIMGANGQWQFSRREQIDRVERQIRGNNIQETFRIIHENMPRIPPLEWAGEKLGQFAVAAVAGGLAHQPATHLADWLFGWDLSRNLDLTSRVMMARLIGMGEDVQRFRNSLPPHLQQKFDDLMRDARGLELRRDHMLTAQTALSQDCLMRTITQGMTPEWQENFFRGITYGSLLAQDGYILPAAALEFIGGLAEGLPMMAALGALGHGNAFANLIHAGFMTQMLTHLGVSAAEAIELYQRYRNGDREAGVRLAQALAESGTHATFLGMMAAGIIRDNRRRAVSTRQGIERTRAQLAQDYTRTHATLQEWLARRLPESAEARRTQLRTIEALNQMLRHLEREWEWSRQRLQIAEALESAGNDPIARPQILEELERRRRIQQEGLDQYRRDIQNVEVGAQGRELTPAERERIRGLGEDALHQMQRVEDLNADIERLELRAADAEELARRRQAAAAQLEQLRRQLNESANATDRALIAASLTQVGERITAIENRILEIRQQELNQQARIVNEKINDAAKKCDRGEITPEAAAEAIRTELESCPTLSESASSCPSCGEASGPATRTSPPNNSPFPPSERQAWRQRIRDFFAEERRSRGIEERDRKLADDYEAMGNEFRQRDSDIQNRRRAAEAERNQRLKDASSEAERARIQAEYNQKMNEIRNAERELEAWLAERDFDIKSRAQSLIQEMTRLQEEENYYLGLVEGNMPGGGSSTQANPPTQVLPGRAPQPATRWTPEERRRLQQTMLNGLNERLQNIEKELSDRNNPIDAQRRTSLERLQREIQAFRDSLQERIRTESSGQPPAGDTAEPAQPGIDWNEVQRGGQSPPTPDQTNRYNYWRNQENVRRFFNELLDDLYSRDPQQPPLTGEELMRRFQEAHRRAHSGADPNNPRPYHSEVDPQQSRPGEFRNQGPNTIAPRLSPEYPGLAEAFREIERSAREQGIQDPVVTPEPNQPRGRVIEINLDRLPEGARPWNTRTPDGRPLHFHPHADHIPHYFRAMADITNEIASLRRNGASREAILRRIAEFYQYAINAHPFNTVNNSMIMNLVNAMIRIWV